MLAPLRKKKKKKANCLSVVVLGLNVYGQYDQSKE